MMLRRSSRLVALACALLAVTAWSSAFVGIRFALREVSPGPLVLMRFSVASACFVILLMSGRVKWPDKQHLPSLVLLGLLGQAVYQFALSIAQTRITAGTAGILIALVPVMSALLAMPVLGEQMSRRGWYGMVLAFTGVVLVSLGADGGIGFEPMTLLGLIAAAASAGYFVLQKRWLGRYSALDLTAYGVWVGMGAALVFAPQIPQAIRAASVHTLLAIAYLGVVPTALGYTLWSFALAQNSTGEVASLLYLEPVITFLLAWIILTEVPAFPAIIGGLLTLVGVILVTKKYQSKPFNGDRSPEKNDSRGIGTGLSQSSRE